MPKNKKSDDYDFDYIVVGSGFGGSVAAMRLSQKGYKVGVIESGKQWNEDRFPKTNWNIRKYLWLPGIFCYGIQRLNLLRDVFILSGAGVGGGSLNYANTLYVPSDTFFERETVKRLDKKNILMRYYKIAKKMLGVVDNPVFTEQDTILKEIADEMGRGHTFSTVPVGVFFGEKGVPSKDPYFFGEGPERIGCELCGECLTGCKKNAKNTLDKNYLYFAQKFGTQIIPENKVIDIIPLSPNGNKGYDIKTKKITGIFGKLRGSRFRTRGLVIAAGTLGTLSLLLTMRQKKRLPKISESLGKYTRTNSEAILSIKMKSKDVDFSKGVAITSSIYPDEHTHIEPVRYGKGHDSLGLLIGFMTDAGPFRRTRTFFNALIHPITFLRTLNPFGSAHRTMVLLVMQTLDNYLNIKRKRTLAWPFTKILSSEYGDNKKNPIWIPLSYDIARKIAKKKNGIPMNIFTENLMNAPLTAHIMGGCTIGPKPEEGIIDEENRVKGYENMIVCDGSQIPENLGVNPSLSIVAFAERAMSFIQPKNKKMQYLKAEKKWGVVEDLVRKSKYNKIS